VQAILRSKVAVRPIRKGEANISAMFLYPAAGDGDLIEDYQTKSVSQLIGVDVG